MGRVYAVVSAKGGVGKTTTAANLAAVLAAAGSDVAVVDGDLGMANLASALGVSIGDVTLHDVLADASEAQSAAGSRTDPGDADVDEAIHEGPHGMAVVPGSPDLDAFSSADPEGLESVLETLRERYAYVVLDTGAGLSNDTVVPLTHVDEALLVSTPTRDALGDTDKTRQVADRGGGRRTTDHVRARKRRRGGVPVARGDSHGRGDRRRRRRRGVGGGGGGGGDGVRSGRVGRRGVRRRNGTGCGGRSRAGRVVRDRRGRRGRGSQPRRRPRSRR